MSATATRVRVLAVLTDRRHPAVVIEIKPVGVDTPTVEVVSLAGAVPRPANPADQALRAELARGTGSAWSRRRSA